MNKNSLYGIILLIILAIGGYAAYMKFSPAATLNKVDKSVTFQQAYGALVDGIGGDFTNIKKFAENKIYSEKMALNVDVQAKEATGKGLLILDSKAQTADKVLDTKTKADINFVGNVDINSPMGKITASLDAKALLSMVNGKIFVNLDKFVMESSQEELKSQLAYLETFKNKWIMVADTSALSGEAAQTDIMNSSTQQIVNEMFGFVDTIKGSAKKYPFVKSIGQSQEGDYVVFALDLDKDNIKKFVSEVGKSTFVSKYFKVTGEQVDQGVAAMDEPLSKFTFKGNLKVKNLSNMIFEITEFKIEDVIISGKINKMGQEVSGDLTFTGSSKEKFSISFKSPSNESISFNGNLSMADKQVFAFDFTLNSIVTADKSNMKLKGNVSGEWGKVNVDLTDDKQKMDKLDEEITEPKDAQNLQDMMGAMMGGSVPTDETGGAENFTGEIPSYPIEDLQGTGE